MAKFVVTLSHGKEKANYMIAGLTLAKAAAEEGIETSVILMLEGIYAATKDYCEGVDIGPPFLSLEETLEAFLAAGGKIKVCKSCMDYYKVKESDLIDEAEVLNGPAVVKELMSADRTLQMN